jgi:hypothetical protein
VQCHAAPTGMLPLAALIVLTGSLVYVAEDFKES